LSNDSFLEENSSIYLNLKELDLSENSLKENFFVSFSRLLEANHFSNLNCLNLEKCELEDEVYPLIVQLIKNASSLT